MPEHRVLNKDGIPGMKIAIAGPGRSGTSLLVRLFAEWGFAVPPHDGNWHEGADAGLESRIGEDSGYEVDKDPFAHEYLDRIPASKLTEYDALFVPIRNRRDAAISRSVQERASRARHSDSDHWRWDSWGTVAGGAVAQTDVEGITGTLARGLWDLLVKATASGLTPVLLNFPRFANDFDYLWSQVGPIVEQRQSKESAFAAWGRVVDLGKVRIGESDSAATTDARILELEALVELLREEYWLGQAAHDDAMARRDEALEEVGRASFRESNLEVRLVQVQDEKAALASTLDATQVQLDATEAQLDATQRSTSWRMTAPLRFVKDVWRTRGNQGHVPE